MSRNEPVGPRQLRAVPNPGAFQGYADWEAVYQDNATWVYRTPSSRGSATGRTPRTSPPRCSSPRCSTAAPHRERCGGARLPAGYCPDGARRALARDAGTRDHLDRGHRAATRERGSDQRRTPTCRRGSRHICRTTIGGSWNCASWKAVRSRSQPRNSGSPSPMPRCCNIARCDLQRRSTMGASCERAKDRANTSTYLLRGRRPKAFVPDDFEAAQIRTAIELRAARPGRRRPRARNSSTICTPSRASK